MRIPLLAALLAASLGFGAHQAHAVSVSFDDIGAVHGTALNAVAGITINVTNNGGGPNVGVLFDTEGIGGPDTDLQRLGGDGLAGWDPGNLAAGSVFDLALIIQENTTGCADTVCNDPDDEAGGGVIELIFSGAISSFGLDVLDIDSGESTGGLTFYDGATGVFMSFQDLIGGSLGNNTANQIAPITLQHDALVAANFDGIDRIEILFRNSGAIDNLEYERVPEPGTALLLCAALVGLGRMRRRRR